MTAIPFKTFEEATEYFGIKFPRRFIDKILIIDNFCQLHQLETLDILFDTFGLLRIEGNEARYQQTPIEFFPFGSIGTDGIHYGFVIHTTDEDDYPAGEICPMDDEGVVLISNTTSDLFQNLLCDNSFLNNYPNLYKELNLTNNFGDRERYDLNGDTLRISVRQKEDWTFMNTKDGAGVFAENRYFNKQHQTKYDTLNRHKGIEEYQSLANEIKA